MLWALRHAVDLERVLDSRLFGTINGVATLRYDSVVTRGGEGIILGPKFHNGNRTVLHTVGSVLNKFTTLDVVLGETQVITS